MKAGTTIRVRGEGGSEWDQDVPEPGTTQRELLDYQIAKNQITVLGDPDPDVVDVDLAAVTDSPEAVAEALASVLLRYADLDEFEQSQVREYVEAVLPDDLGLGGPLTSDPATGGQPSRPNVRAGKPEWVTYAVKARGADPVEAEAMTKEALIERYGKEN